MFKPENVNLRRIGGYLDQLAQMGRNENGGITRYTFSPAHGEATTVVSRWMADAGLDVFFDRWGNLYGTTPGRMPYVVSGSHLDSVPNGGNFDGPLGVLSALEAVQLILERGITLAKPLMVVSFIEEEGARFRGLLGSTLATGQVSANDVVDGDGVKLVDALAGINFSYRVEETFDLRDGVDSYVELHIEQGTRLERANEPVGVVTGIAGPTFMRVWLAGRSDHAGATEYTARQDTLLAAAEIIRGVRTIGETEFAGRGHMTVGRIEAHPNVTNVIAGETVLDIDYRAGDAETQAAMQSAIAKLLDQTSREQDVTYMAETLHTVAPTPTPERIRSAVVDGAVQAGLSASELVSWAAHDAMLMAQVTAAGMVFVRCQDGRSHTPEEFVTLDDIAAGVAVLANTLVRLAT